MSETPAVYGAKAKRRKNRMHGNSLDAHRSNRYDARSRAIIEEIRNRGPGTDHELAMRLGLGHRQDVAPRVTTLLGLGALVEVGERRDRDTGKTCRVVDLNAERGTRNAEGGQEWRGWQGWQDRTQNTEPTLGV